MPLPKPSPSQSEKEFISSCMSSDIMNKEYSNNKQRYAVCNSLWDKNKKRAKGSEDEIKWENQENSGFLVI